MALQTTIYITSRQRKGLFARARKRKTSFSDELRSAVDFYLASPSPSIRRSSDSWRARLRPRLSEALPGLTP
jgi:hypothetical protein